MSGYIVFEFIYLFPESRPGLRRSFAELLKKRGNQPGFSSQISDTELLQFFFGFTSIHSGNAFWKTILKWRWLFLSFAVILFSVRFIVFDLKAPNYLMAVESNTWIFAIFGLAYRYLNHPSKTLHYLSQGAYPIYIIHMIFLSC